MHCLKLYCHYVIISSVGVEAIPVEVVVIVAGPSGLSLLPCGGKLLLLHIRQNLPA